MTTEGFMGWYLQRSRFAQTCGRISIHFFIGGLEDAELGKKVVLAVTHSPTLNTDSLLQKLKANDKLDAYECPKSILVFDEFVETDSGKIKRMETLKLKPKQILDL